MPGAPVGILGKGIDKEGLGEIQEVIGKGLIGR